MALAGEGEQRMECSIAVNWACGSGKGPRRSHGPWLHKLSTSPFGLCVWDTAAIRVRGGAPSGPDPCWEWRSVRENAPQPSHQPSVCSAAHTRPYGWISPLLSGLWWEEHLLCLTASLAHCIYQNLLAAEGFFFVVLFHHRPTSAGVTSLFWKWLFHIRILMLQSSILHVLVLGWFCGSAGYPLILLKDLTLLTARDFLHRKGKSHFWSELCWETQPLARCIFHICLCHPSQSGATASKTTEREEPYKYGRGSKWICLNFGLKFWLASHSSWTSYSRSWCQRTCVSVFSLSQGMLHSPQQAPSSSQRTAVKSQMRCCELVWREKHCFPSE